MATDTGWRPGLHYKGPRKTKVVTTNRSGTRQTTQVQRVSPKGKFVGRPKTVQRNATVPAKNRSRPRQQQYRRAQRQARSQRQAAKQGQSFRFLEALVGTKGGKEDAGIANRLSDRSAGNLFGARGSVDQANYADLYDELWKHFHGFYPKAKEPKLVFEPGAPTEGGGQSAYAFVDFAGPTSPAAKRQGKSWETIPARKRTVHVTPAGVMAANRRPEAQPFIAGTPSSRNAHNLGLAVPLHEWVHAFQNAKLPNPTATEGGAEALAQILAPKAGLRYRRYSNDPYERYRRKAVSKGIDWIMKRQFGG